MIFMRGKESLLDAVFIDSMGRPLYASIEYTYGRRGPTQFFLYTKGRPGCLGLDKYGDPATETSRAISADEARAWVQARINAGDIRESVGREVLEYLQPYSALIFRDSASASASA